MPQQRGQPCSRGIHSSSKRSICPEDLHPQRDLNKKKTSLTFNTQGESTESAVKRKTSLQAHGVILFWKSTKVNKHSTLRCGFPKNFSSEERGSDSQALKEGPGTERLQSQQAPRVWQMLLTCSSPGAGILAAITSQPRCCCVLLAVLVLTLCWLCCSTWNSWTFFLTVTSCPLH